MDIGQSGTYWAKIYIAGDYNIARQSCREYCMKGLCINISRTNYVYAMGEEEGVCVELVNYPRFISSKEEILEDAKALGEKLTIDLCQGSFMLMTPDTTYYFSRHEEIRERNKTEERLL